MTSALFGHSFVLHVVMAVLSLATMVVVWIRTKGMVRSFRVLMVAPMLPLAVLAVMFFEMTIDLDNVGYLSPFLCAYVICCFSLVLAADRVTVSSDRRYQRFRMEEARRQKEAEGLRSEEYEALAEASEKTRVELLGRIEEIDTALSLQDAEGAMKIASDSLESLDRLRIERLCAHRGVDAVLSLKAKECADCGIAFSSRVDIPNDIPLDGAELCSVFFNALDNAINANETVPEEQRFIRVVAGVRKGILIVRVENAAQRLSMREKMRGLNPLREHGWGLKIISHIAETHGGVATVSFEPLGDKDVDATEKGGGRSAQVGRVVTEVSFSVAA